MSHEKDIDAADWTDQDLLTRDEASDRLVDEIALTRNRLVELKAQSQDDPTVAASMMMVNRRLVAMENLRDSL
ncbi:UNVERIFIED_ORG: hypothetical protein FNL38_102234 [Nocardia globerula]|uniref:Uncharacterized protein n=1 Tax=Nocardia globerula TaxID=1818 RepID=A0A652YT71_NOCGL|nr:hypothetical protein [Rhodococcus globerulus]NMD61375.1 hypothetical protein [Nocardia globerula]PVX67075.1 hypothetical protein C8E04_4422 [Rhodococcus globerulus]